MSEAAPRFVTVDLTEMSESGVLMLVNELVLWPLGLALTWDRSDDGTCSNLHIRQWEYDDGHRETIEMVDDDLASRRRDAFGTWASNRRALLPPAEWHGLDALVERFTR
jgi:hypothetical protein